MTDSAVTDGDLRNARLWAEKVCPPSVSPGYIGTPIEIHSAARVILATVEAPALSEELSRIAEGWEGWTTCAIDEALAAATTRAEQVEHELAEAHDELERLAAVRKGAESNAESLDPADVKPGEAWLVEVDGERRTAVKDGNYDEPWNAVTAEGWLTAEENEEVTLVSRLVPAPRVITNADDLEQLAEGAIIRSRDGEACRKSDGGDWSVDGLDGAVGYGPRQVLPVTVLWEPEA